MSDVSPTRAKLPNEALLAAIVDSSFDAIVSKDLDSIITSWNPAAERMFGYSSEEAVGKPVLILIPEPLQGEETDIISRIRRGERVATYETIRRRKDGSTMPVSLTISPVRATGGEIVGASKIARDITERREREQRIRTLLSEVNHRVKNQFAVIISIMRETAKKASEPREFEDQLRGRVLALARSHDLLMSTDWSGASLVEVLHEHMKPFGRETQVSVAGPLLTLPPHAVQYLGMAFYELATNSIKYGALSHEVGRVSVNWQIVAGSANADEVELVWEEVSPSTPAPRTSRNTGHGFGTTVLERIAPEAIGGVASLHRESGLVRWTLRAPLSGIGPSVT